MSRILYKGTLFRIEDINASLAQWAEFCDHFGLHGYPKPEIFDGDEIIGIYSKKKKLGGFIESSRHLRYRSYIAESDQEALEIVEDITWNPKTPSPTNVIAINCLWRRRDSGLIGRLATTIIYLSIMNRASISGDRILAGAANSRLISIYKAWGPQLSFSYRHNDVSLRELFLFHPDSGITAITKVISKILRFRWNDRWLRAPRSSMRGAA
jgi:hypothetical protein